ncbi:MAG TPA: SAM-dependent methyltransferase [Pseudonocardiaceae bacterium]|nr:SAM-dependent methyltransferase [Pseudonocardiaceae bacterium]
MDKPAAQTAVGPMVVCAIDQFERHPLIEDKLAARMLPGALRPIVTLSRWSGLRRFIRNKAENHTPGIWSNMLCRKRYIDDKVLEAVAGGISRLVILGAGLDTRAYRLPELATAKVFEVDQPINIDRKRARLLKVFNGIPAHVSLVPIDFRTQHLGEVLASAGYEPDQPTVFVWEGVTQYLTEEAIDATGKFLAGAAPGSRLVFTYVQENFLTGQTLYGAQAAYLDFVVRRGLWQFGLAPAAVEEFLGRYGWQEIEQAGSAEYTDRYLRPNNRLLATTELERSVYAGKMS